MNSDNRSSTPDHIKAQFQKIVTDGAIPAKSRKNYAAAYKKYVDWKELNQIPVISNSESVIGCYINSLVGSIVPTSLWVTLSMIRSHILVDTGVMIKTPIVNATIKRLCDGYIPKQAAVLTKDQFGQFLLKQSNEHFLVQKAIIAIGLSGALRKCEIYNMQFGDVKQLEGTFLINIPRTKTNTTGSFAVTSPINKSSPLNYYEYLERYHKLRVALGPASKPYLMQVRFGKCTRQRIGEHSIANIPQMVAKLLGLDNPKSFTGHSFRRSSTTTLAESGADILTIQRHGRWQSSTVAERYMSESVAHRVSVAQRICYEAEATTSAGNASVGACTQTVAGISAAVTGLGQETTSTGNASVGACTQTVAGISAAVTGRAPFSINFGNNNSFAGTITLIVKQKK